MNKKIMFPIIIIVGFILSLVPGALLTFICTIPFFVLILIYFRTDKLMIAFAVLSILTMFTRALVTSPAPFFISAILSIAALIAAFAISLQEKYKAILRYSLVYVAAVYFALTSTIMLVLNYMLMSLIGEIGYFIFYIILMLGVIIAEVVCIVFLIDYDRYEVKKDPLKTSYVFEDGEWVKAEE